MSSALPRRIEVKDLQPGDTFEYPHTKTVKAFREDGPYREWDAGAGRYLRFGYDVLPVMKQDTVKSDGPWRCWWGPADVAVDVRTIEKGKEAGEVWALIHTEVGQSNHGWVSLKADAVVVLLDREASA